MWLFVLQYIVEWCDGLCSVQREGDTGWERAVDDLLFTVSVSGWREVGGREGGGRGGETPRDDVYDHVIVVCPGNH